MSDKILYGTSVHNENYIRTNNGHHLLFRNSNKTEVFGIDDESLFQHVLFLGGSGFGKTNVIAQAVSQLRNWESSPYQRDDGVFLIFDTKADYYRHHGFFKSNDYVIGNSKRFRKQSEIWNVFEEVMADGDDPQDYENNADEIAKQLFIGRGSATQPFFADTAKLIFKNTLIYFIRRYRDNYAQWHNKLNNKFLREFLLGNTPDKLAEYFSLYDDLKGNKTYFGVGENNQAAGIFSELRGMVENNFKGIFALEPPRGETGFSIRKAIREKNGKAIFIEYDMATGQSLTPMYSLLVDLALKEALSENANGRTHLILDELKLLPKLSHLDDALNFGRSKKVSVIAGLQSTNQIYAAYGKEQGQVILGGFGSVIAFKTPDHESRDYIVKLFGPNVTSYRYYDPNNKPVDRERDGNTVEHWDIQKLKRGQAIVGLASQDSPFMFNFEKDPYT